jgi:hypothetical protein
MGQQVVTTGSELYSPDTFRTTAGGTAELFDCNVGGYGTTSEQPAFSLFLTGMESYGRLEIEATSACDTTLLARTPDGRWHFDDDGNGNLQPLLNLTPGAALNGRVDVWVGALGGETCPAEVEFETWNN